jgi:group I intron endonuclease
MEFSGTPAIEEASCVIYLVRNRLNDKVYVGKTKNGVEKRWLEHIKDAIRGSELMLHRAIRKHGADAFEIFLLSSYAGSPQDLNEQERYFIAKYRAYPPQLGFGYNMSPGGDGGAEIVPKTRSASTRQKMSDVWKT